MVGEPSFCPGLLALSCSAVGGRRGITPNTSRLEIGGVMMMARGIVTFASCSLRYLRIGRKVIDFECVHVQVRADLLVDILTATGCGDESDVCWPRENDSRPVVMSIICLLNVAIPTALIFHRGLRCECGGLFMNKGRNHSPHRDHAQKEKGAYEKNAAYEVHYLVSRLPENVRQLDQVSFDVLGRQQKASAAAAISRSCAHDVQPPVSRDPSRTALLLAVTNSKEPIPTASTAGLHIAAACARVSSNQDLSFWLKDHEIIWETRWAIIIKRQGDPDKHLWPPRNGIPFVVGY
ncbi:hypothetical protein F5Y18DRAFT_175847 [Xylariaceae sp. FL1019]|nr:hypothetical protein F5Y18DRAFT_175847 [Xylariaceae sp. FL1019]